MSRLVNDGEQRGRSERASQGEGGTEKSERRKDIVKSKEPRSLHLLEETRWFGRRLKAEKTSGAARVSFIRDIRLLVGKMPTFYYGLF